jgi:hypothetical protein
MILVPEDFLEVTRESASFWLSRVYLKVPVHPTDFETSTFILHIGRMLWLTDVIMEGNTVNSRAIDVNPSSTERHALRASSAPLKLEPLF